MSAVANRSIARLAAQTASAAARRTTIAPSCRASASASLAIAARRQQRQQLSTAIPPSRRSLAFKVKPQATPAVTNQQHRAYSQDAASTQAGESSKIWSFEDIKALAAKGDKADVIIVDAREPSELSDSGRIPGAINIPITTQPDSFHISEDEFEDRFGYPRPPKDAEVVFYCKAGVRSRAAAQLARSAGWTKTGEYPGSWLDWVANGGKIQR